MSALVPCAFSPVPVKHPSLYQNPCRNFSFIVGKTRTYCFLFPVPLSLFYRCFASPPAVSLGTRPKTILSNLCIGTTSPTKKFEVNGNIGGLTIDVANTMPTINTERFTFSISSCIKTIVRKRQIASRQTT